MIIVTIIKKIFNLVRDEMFVLSIVIGDVALIMDSMVFWPNQFVSKIFIMS